MIVPVDAPTQQIVCSVAASVKYQVPANVLLAIAEIEGGRVGEWSPNDNGTYDVGVMQFNTAYLADLEKEYGIKADDVAHGDCYPYELAAWRLRGHLHEQHGDLWTRAAYYHSRTPKFNSIYRDKLIKVARKWQTWLVARFATKTIEATSSAEVNAKVHYNVAAEAALASSFKVRR